jgi:glycosyltransferase involved in cell wall biosynthesis
MCAGSAGAAMRIVILGPTYPFRGGIAHYTALLAQHLAVTHEVTLLSFAGQYPLPLYPGRTDRDPSRQVVGGPAEHLLAPLRPWTWWRTARRVATLEPRLFIVQWWVPWWAPSVAVVTALVRRWTDARQVFICHNVLPHDGGGRLTRAWVSLALRHGDAFVVHAESDEASLRRILPPRDADKACIVQAVLPFHTIASPVDPRLARQVLGLPAEAAVALFFGFVRPYKGLAHLIDGVAEALATVPDLHLVVAGEFWQPVAAYRHHAEARGVTERVHIFDRYVPNEEVGPYFAAADVVVLPYVAASQSGVVTLAAQFGRPVIATATGGLPEAVLDGRTGLIVPPGDAHALAAALARFFAEPGLAERLRTGVAATADRFSWDRLVALLETLAESSP